MKILLVNRKDNLRIRVELDPNSTNSEMLRIAEDVWGCEDVLLRRGHYLLPDDGLVKDYLEEGDYIEVLPNPFGGIRRR